MEAKSTIRFKKLYYVRGPHIRYFFFSLLIAFSMATLLVAGAIMLMRSIFSWN